MCSKLTAPTGHFLLTTVFICLHLACGFLCACQLLRLEDETERESRCRSSLVGHVILWRFASPCSTYTPDHVASPGPSARSFFFGPLESVGGTCTAIWFQFSRVRAQTPDVLLRASGCLHARAMGLDPSHLRPSLLFRQRPPSSPPSSRNTYALRCCARV